MPLEKLLATTLGELTIANAKQALAIEALRVELSKRDGTIAELQRELDALRSQKLETIDVVNGYTHQH